MNNEKSVNTFDRAYQSRLGQISTDFNNNVTNFWNNFKPQRDIETAKEIINYQQVSDYVKKGSTTPELQSLDRNTSFEIIYQKTKKKSIFLTPTIKTKDFL